MDHRTSSQVTREQDGGSCNRIFQSGWWLQAAGGGKCETVEVQWAGRRVGALTFLRTCRFGMTLLRMPPYTRTLDPVIVPPLSKPFQRLSNTRRILHALLAKLPRHDQFLIALSPCNDKTIPFAFEVAGFQLGEAFTFISSPAMPLDAIWAGMDQKTRNLVRSAGRVCQVTESGDFDRFEALSRREYAEIRARSGTTHDYAILRSLHAEARGRAQSTILFATQDSGDAASIILIWDDEVMYYWTSARDRTRAGGASALLLWHALGMAHARGLALDLDGYSSPATARFLASFGLSPVVRPVVEGSSVRYRAARLARDAVMRRPTR